MYHVLFSLAGPLSVQDLSKVRDDLCRKRNPSFAVRKGFFFYRNILDSENWRASDVPEHFQRLVDKSLEMNRLTDVTQLEGESPPPKPNLICDGEPYVVVG